ncbi:sensor histidine kinase [Tahibacter amnicola]|uniref:Histidine kinase n=1 Tax=Tahibacter amnicola TaxID=2976241 RepID=A0ABY6BHP9_9GAMM|nr:histidine kinase [Tahibacter amnicola]UXI69037.1 histidine kinase [Tahibacter amnicola]
MAQARSTRSDHDYWACQLGGWCALTALSVLSTSFGPWESVWRFALAKTLCMGAGLALSHQWRGYLRRRGWLHGNAAVPFRPIFIGLLALAALATAALVLVDLIIRNGALLAEPAEVPVLIAFILLGWFAVFAMWTVCYSAALSRRRALRMELDLLKLEVNAKDTELRALQSQVNPHFFFNSLNSIRSLIYQDRDAAAQAVTRLASMMRHSLQAGASPTARLAEELAAIDAYLSIEHLRFDDRLQLRLQIEPGLEEVKLPPMALQTLVENAVKHGVERSTGACELRVSAQRHGDRVLLSVANQGRLSESSESTRLGLANTAKRLNLLFGTDAACSLLERDGWVVASIELPQACA